MTPDRTSDFFPKQDAQPEFEVFRPLKPAIICQRSLRRIVTKMAALACGDFRPTSKAIAAESREPAGDLPWPISRKLRASSF